MCCVWGVDRGVKCIVWSVGCKGRSVKGGECKVWSLGVKCRVWGGKTGVCV
jgi:hypothetical protein